ncbi:AAA family ATPase [Candidatus Micrarchaeota archaeon]|nr:AAA family ATPase [Candidatus Micrarchaeota archaeon]MBI5176663.1 AAA family ATPase [Candidatus Micrarchaeota archaeon]
MPSFDELLSGKGVFVDKSVLSPHYIPETLHFRDEEIRKIMLGVAPVLQGTKAKNLFIYGGTGTGKTSSVRQVIAKLKERGVANVYSTYMNCRVYDSRYKVLQKIISDFKPHFSKTGHSFSVLYEELLDWLEQGSGEEKKGRHLIVALDEIDVVKDLDNLVYTLVRINDDVQRGSLAIIGVSNKVNFKQRLDPRSKSALYEEEVVFQPYNAEQLSGILRNRAASAFEKGVVDESAVNLASAIAAGENGDARYALLLLLRAGELCEELPDKKISDSEIERARKLADEDKAFEVISTLPEHQQLLLYSLACLAEDVSYRKLVEDNGEKLYFSGEVYERYASLSRKLGRDPRSSRWYREYLNELELLGLVQMVGSGKGVRGHTTLLKLAYDAPRVKKAVEKTIMAE